MHKHFHALAIAALQGQAPSGELVAVLLEPVAVLLEPLHLLHSTVACLYDEVAAKKVHLFHSKEDGEALL